MLAAHEKGKYVLKVKRRLHWTDSNGKTCMAPTSFERNTYIKEADSKIIELGLWAELWHDEEEARVLGKRAIERSVQAQRLVDLEACCQETIDYHGGGSKTFVRDTKRKIVTAKDGKLLNEQLILWERRLQKLQRSLQRLEEESAKAGDKASSDPPKQGSGDSLGKNTSQSPPKKRKLDTDEESSESDESMSSEDEHRRLPYGYINGDGGKRR